ncbi:MAG TPA: GNAT family N-acetyltransferase, partial [Anaerolineae bacterium]|nr:GNAT family N-acetyltransferase [Anaerolineae bacterium]
MWSVRQLIAEGEILPFLQSDWRYAAYAIADLDLWFFAQCRWWLAESILTVEGSRADVGRTCAESSPVRPWALVLLFAGLEPPAVFGLGDPSGVAAILDQAALPERVYFTVRPEHWPTVREHYRLQFEVPMLRMVLGADALPDCGSDAVRRLEAADLGSLRALYALGKPGDADGFAPFQIERGVFFGWVEDEKLVSVAGTHLVSLRHGLAAVGNVFTDPAYRGRGHALACTRAVTAALLDQRLSVVLNVAVHNTAAVSLYRRLGYKTYCRFFEGVGASKRSTAWS